MKEKKRTKQITETAEKMQKEKEGK